MRENQIVCDKTGLVASMGIKKSLTGGTKGFSSWDLYKHKDSVFPDHTHTSGCLKNVGFSYLIEYFFHAAMWPESLIAIEPFRSGVVVKTGGF